MAIPPFLVEKAAGIEIEDALPAAVSRKLDGRAMAAFCGLYPVNPGVPVRARSAVKLAPEAPDPIRAC